MGWCSGTGIFDAVVEKLLESGLPEQIQVEIIVALTNAMEDHDWDCQYDSAYFGNPIVMKAWKEIDPERFEDEDE